MEDLKISVIVPSYNQGKFIENIIQSTICQSYSNWELIIQDGNSSDETKSVCEKYAEKDNRISFYSEKDDGYADAVNKAMDKASGSIGIIQSSDDFFAYPNVFTDVINIWKQNSDLIILSGLAVMVNEDFEHLDIQKNDYSFVSPEKIYMGHFFNQSATFFSMQRAIEINKLDINVDMVADTDFWIRLSCENPIAFVNKFLQTTSIWGGVVVQPLQRSAELSKFYKGRAQMAYKHYMNDRIPFAKEFKKHKVNKFIYEGISYFKYFNINYNTFTELYEKVNNHKFNVISFTCKGTLKRTLKFLIFLIKKTLLNKSFKFSYLRSSKSEILNDTTINSHNIYKWW
jgi:glycosyltransferase involved in cell wall biosynthesis